MTLKRNRTVVASPKGFTIIELLVIIGILGLLACILLVAVQNSRAAAQRMGCSNNLRQIGVGLNSHLSAHGYYPPQNPSPNKSPGSSFSRQGISWHAYILPYIEHHVLWNEVVDAYNIDRNPWSSPHFPLLAKVVSPYVCPSDSRLKSPLTDPSGIEAAYTSYVGMIGHIDALGSGLFARNRGVTPSQITDGLSNTIAIGERPPPPSLSLGWWYTTHKFSNIQAINDFELPAESGVNPDDRQCDGLPISWTKLGNVNGYFFSNGNLNNECDKYHYWSLHDGGANFVFADGSVRFLSYGIYSHLRDLATISGGEAHYGL